MKQTTQALDSFQKLSSEKRALLRRKLSERTGRAAIPTLIPSRAGEKTTPLSFAQQGMWLLEQLEPGNPVYNRPQALRLSGNLDRDALKRGIDAILERHQVLRSRFGEEQGVPVQYAGEPREMELSTLDLGALSPEDRVAELQRLYAEDARCPFDLERGPLIRAILYELEKQEHVLVIVVHHIVFDGWSMDIFMRELSSFYNFFVTGSPVNQPELSVQFADYAAWQREQMTEVELQRLMDYWMDQLVDIPALDLPTDHQRPAMPSRRGAIHEHVLPRRLGNSVRGLAQREDVTLFMLLLGAFQLLLHRYACDDDVVIGTPVAGRQHVDTEPLIGVFINTVLLRMRFRDGMTVRELLHDVRDVALDAYAHQELPFEMIAQRLAPLQDTGRKPLYQVYFQLRGMSSSGIGMHDLTIEHQVLDPGIARLDLNLEILDSTEGLTCLFEYSKDLFESSTVERMAHHYERVLEGMVENPDQPVDMLPLLTKDGREALLVEINDTVVSFPKGMCVHQLIEEQVERTPDAVAVVHGQTVMSYAELKARADRLARFLVGRGVGPGVLVGVSMERSADMTMTLLGILKAGGAYVPLDSSQPRKRLDFILEDSGVSMLLTQERLVSLFEHWRGPKFCVDAHEGLKGRGDHRAHIEPPTPDSLAYVIYTSGSTGTPKGVAVTHGSLMNYIQFAGDEYAIRETDRVLQFASISFDAAGEEIFPCWAQGATLVLRTETMLDSVPTFLERCREWGITVLSLPTAFWHGLTDVLAQGGGVLPEPIRLVLIGGEQAQKEKLRQWRRCVGDGVRLINTYGPTEATIVATYCDLSRLKLEDLGDHEVPIGRPIANTQVYVLDDHLQPVPVSIPGELCIAGAGLAQGYLKRPDLTTRQFVPNPYGDSANPRLYRTGDRVRVLPDGLLEFLGRTDRQIKLRGFRIEPGEIETALREHPLLREAIVIQHRNDAGAQLLAYVVPDRESRPEGRELRVFLGTRLPAYMVPSIFVALDELPMTTSGKVDHQALPEPDRTLTRSGSDYLGPRSTVEETLAEIWSEVLGVPRIGMEDSFFELGGHSLLATQLMSRVRMRLLVEIPLRKLFERPTVAGLAELVQQVLDDPSDQTRNVRETDAGIGGEVFEFPLSFAQQRLWFLDQFEPDSGLYNITKAFRVGGPLDEDALNDALNHLVERHESLRTTFAEREGKPVQVIAAKQVVEISVINLAPKPEVDREAEIERRLAEEARQPFDLMRGPLIRATLFRLGDSDRVFMLSLHHIVSDGWSMGILFRELSVYYEACVSGKSAALKELPIQYADFAVWQRDWMQGDQLVRQLAYWKGHLDGLETLELPLDGRRPAVQTFNGGRRNFDLPEGLTRELREIARQEGVTLYMVLLTAFEALMHRYSGQDDIVVGTPIAGRNRSEIEGLIGFFVNTLVLRTNCSGDPSFRDLLAQTREVALGAYTHQDLPLERLVEELQPSRDLSRNPLFQVLFALQNAPSVDLRLVAVEVQALLLDADTAKFDLSLFMTEVGHGLSGTLVYNTDLFEAGTAVRLIEHFTNLLRGVLTNPDARLSDIPLYSKEERGRLINGLNDTLTDYPREACIHSVFEAQVKRTPHAVAVVFEQRQLTYRELNARANRLARYLRRTGVGPEVMVGICVERSLDMVVGILGVLKAGGAYVPLDPEYPRQRLAFMLEDTQAPLLLTQSHLLDRLTEGKGEVICLDRDWPAISAESELNLLGGATADNLAYVIYTSGSTGRPKGTCVVHRGVVRLVKNTNYIELDPQEVFLQLAPISFDASTFELWGSLLNGARLIVFPPHVPLLEELGAFISRSRITTLWLTAALFHEMVDHQPEALAGVRQLLAGGEALSVNHVERMLKRLGEGQRLINGYGPTENTTFTCCHVMDSSSSVGRSVPIGRPISNTRVYVLDDRMELVPMGLPGELYIGGDGLARGYLNQAGLTQERFVADPFGSGQDGVLYRTGDCVRYRPDGTLEFLGRADHQVKIRGYRIEPGEVEAVLRECPEVRDVLVVAREDEPGNRCLVAYVVPSERESPEIPVLRGYLRERLPEYMVPGYYVFLDALPLTPNGKVDRGALPEPVRTEMVAEDERPHTPVEQMLVEIWADVLGLSVDRMRIGDNFFERGGHSLRATQVMSRINETFGVDLPVRLIFSAPTLEGLALAIVEELAEAMGEME